MKKKCHDQKEHGGGKGLFHLKTLRKQFSEKSEDRGKNRVEIWRQELTQSHGRMLFTRWLAPRGLISLPSYSTDDQQLRGNTSPTEPGLPTSTVN